MRLAFIIDGDATGAKQALADTSRALAQVQTAATSSGTAVARGSQSAAAAQGAVKGLSFEAKNLAYQLVDVTQGLLSGQTAFMIFAQQGGQVAQAIAASQGGLGGLMKELGRSVAGLLTPMRLLGLGAGALAVGGYAMYSSWKTAALQLDDTARAAGVAVQTMRDLQSAASVKGIAGGAFLPAMERFATLVYQAQRGLGGLAEVFRANGVQAKTFADHLGRAADLIRNAGSDQQRLVLLQQMGLPATMEWVRFLSQGSEGLRQATAEAVKFGGAAEDQMIAAARHFDEAWNKGWTNFGNSAKGAIVGAVDWLANFNFRVNQVLSGLQPAANPHENLRIGMTTGSVGTRLTPSMADSIYGAVGRGSLPVDASAAQPKKTLDPEALKRTISLYQQYVGVLGQTATVAEQVAAVEKQIQQYELQPGARKLTSDQIANLKRVAEEQALGITQIKAGADAYRLEADTIGMTVGQSAAYLAAQNAINEAKRRGMPLTQENIAAIQREADALGAAAQRADTMKQASDLLGGGLKDFKTSLMQGASAWDAFKNAAGNALNKIADKLLDMAAQKLVQSAFGASGSAGIFSSIGALFGFDQGGYTGDRPIDAIAGVVHGREFVVNATATRRNLPLLQAINDNRLPGYGDGGYVGPPLGSVASPPPRASSAQGSGATYQVTYAPVYQVQGSGAEIDALRAEIARDRAEAPARILKTMKDAERRRVA